MPKQQGDNVQTLEMKYLNLIFLVSVLDTSIVYILEFVCFFSWFCCQNSSNQTLTFERICDSVACIVLNDPMFPASAEVQITFY